jgi:hypothetical protein
MSADEIINAVQTELRRHNFDTFVDNPPSVARGGRGHVVSGCLACKKRMQSLNQFMAHLSDDVLPDTIRKAITEQGQI